MDISSERVQPAPSRGVSRPGSGQVSWLPVHPTRRSSRILSGDCECVPKFAPAAAGDLLASLRRARSGRLDVLQVRLRRPSPPRHRRYASGSPSSRRC